MPALSHIKTSQLICKANQLTGFYMRATLAFNGLKELKPDSIEMRHIYNANTNICDLAFRSQKNSVCEKNVIVFHIESI